MPAEPSLQEISNIAVDPEQGTGTPAVVYDSRDLIHTLNSAANQKAENDWRRYNMLLNNVKDVYKDLDEVAKYEVMGADREILKQKMAEITQGIAKNPRGFFSGGADYQNTLQKVSELYSLSTASKQHSIWDDFNRKAIMAHPEFNTAKNRAIIDEFSKSPIGSRQLYSLSLPGMFDPKALADSIIPSTKVESKDPSVSKDHRYITTVDKVTYDPQLYRQKALALLNAQGKNGESIRSTVEERYNELPSFEKEKYPTLEDYYMGLMNAYLPQDERKASMIADQTYMDDVNAATARGHLNIAQERLNMDKAAAKKAAEAPAATSPFGNIIAKINTDTFNSGGGKSLNWVGPDKKPVKVKIQNGTLVTEHGDVVNRDMVVQVPMSSLDASIITEYNKYAKEPKYNQDGKRISDAAGSQIKANKEGYVTVRVKGGKIDGIQTDDGSYAGEDLFSYLTNYASQRGETKQRTEKDISNGAAEGSEADLFMKQFMHQ